MKSIDPGGPVVIILAFGSEVRGFKPGQGWWIFSEHKNPEYDFLQKKIKAIGPVSVHHCGASGSMRACHAVGPGSIPSRDRFPGWGFSSPVRQMSGNFRPQGPRISFGRQIIIPYSPCWDDWVCAWCVLSSIFVLSRRWPRHWADHSSGEAIHVLVWSKKYVCDP